MVYRLEEHMGISPRVLYGSSGGFWEISAGYLSWIKQWIKTRSRDNEVSSTPQELDLGSLSLLILKAIVLGVLARQVRSTHNNSRESLEPAICRQGTLCACVRIYVHSVWSPSTPATARF